MTAIVEGRIVAGLVAVIAGVTAASAGPLNFGVDAGIGETDNVTLVQSGKVSQTMAVADLDFASSDKGSRFDENITADVTYLDFLQNAYSREVLGRINGSLRYALVPDHLTWTLQDNWGQAQVDPFTATTPTNQENINYLTTGPDWYARLGDSTFVNVGARYARANYQVTPIDSNRYSGSLQLGHEISAHSSLSVVGSVERVEFDNTALNTNYDLDNAAVRYELHGARTDLAVDLGADRVSAAGNATTGPAGQLKLDRKISPAATLSVRVGRALTDTTGGFAMFQGNGIANGTTVNNPVNNAQAPVTASVYTDSYVEAGWQYARNRTSLGLSGRVEKLVYVDQPQYDGTRDLISFNVDRKLSRALSARLFMNLYQNRYDHEQFLLNSGGYTDRDGLYGFIVTLHEGRGLEVRLRGEHMSRNIPAGIGNGYAENRVFLTVGYRPDFGPATQK